MTDASTRLLPVPETAQEPLSSVLSTLRLRRLGDDSYRGDNLPQLSGRIYGGQALAQATVAASDTIEDRDDDGEADRLVHSITAAFLRPGDVNKPVTVDVERVNDGRSFSVRRVFVSQEGTAILSARCSFQLTQPGLEHRSTPPDVPGPGNLASNIDLFAAIDNPVAHFMSSTAAFDLRHIGESLYVRPARERAVTQQLWLRSRTPMPDGVTQSQHRALLAYAADQFMLEPILRAHGLCWMTPGLSVASLDHAVWWHRPVDTGKWILADLISPSAQGARGLTFARFYQDGEHIASMTQEAMVRVPNPEQFNALS